MGRIYTIHIFISSSMSCHLFNLFPQSLAVADLEGGLWCLHTPSPVYIFFLKSHLCHFGAKSYKLAMSRGIPL